MTLTPLELRVQGLLEWYVDVVEGWRGDRRGDRDSGGPASVSAWLSPSYRELEKLRLELKATDRRLYVPIDRRYINVVHRRVLACPSCHRQATFTAAHAGAFCRHAGKRVHWLPASVPVMPCTDTGALLEGIRWLGRGFSRDGVDCESVDLLVNPKSRAA